MASVKGAISLFVGLLMFAIMYPISFDLIYNTSVSGWTPVLKTVWWLLPLVGTVGVVIGAIDLITGSSGGVTALLKVTKSLRLNRKGGSIIGMAVFFIVFAVVVPVAFGLIFQNFANNRTSWLATPYGATVIALAKLIPTISVIGAMISVIYMAIGKGTEVAAISKLIRSLRLKG